MDWVGCPGDGTGTSGPRQDGPARCPPAHGDNIEFVVLTDEAGIGARFSTGCNGIKLVKIRAVFCSMAGAPLI